MEKVVRFLVRVFDESTRTDCFVCDSREAGEEILRSRTEEIAEGWRGYATESFMGPNLSEEEADQLVEQFREAPFSQALEKLSQGLGYTTIEEIDHYREEHQS